ncbi:hypothetical protein V8G54_019728 [Vigna mungo]|uniref:Uncharacterized protein n=1 Tax=Vigna mungo TaxID=3915 RepID=A0AAQ3NC74_VIGMU
MECNKILGKCYLQHACPVGDVYRTIIRNTVQGFILVGYIHMHICVQTKKSLRFTIDRKATHARQGFIKSAAMGLTERNARMHPYWLTNNPKQSIRLSRVAPAANTRGSQSTAKRS